MTIYEQAAKRPKPDIVLGVLILEVGIVFSRKITYFHKLGSFFGVSLQYEPYYLEPIFGPPDF